LQYAPYPCLFEKPEQGQFDSVPQPWLDSIHTSGGGGGGGGGSGGDGGGGGGDGETVTLLTHSTNLDPKETNGKFTALVQLSSV